MYLKSENFIADYWWIPDSPRISHSLSSGALLPTTAIEHTLLCIQVCLEEIPIQKHPIATLGSSTEAVWPKWTVHHRAASYGGYTITTTVAAQLLDRLASGHCSNQDSSSCSPLEQASRISPHLPLVADYVPSAPGSHLWRWGRKGWGYQSRLKAAG